MESIHEVQVAKKTKVLTQEEEIEFVDISACLLQHTENEA
jgi:hypothetical protein